jgi:hypothetical protein
MERTMDRIENVMSRLMLIGCIVIVLGNLIVSIMVLN